MILHDIQNLVAIGNRFAPERNLKTAHNGSGPLVGETLFPYYNGAREWHTRRCGQASVFVASRCDGFAQKIHRGRS